MPLGPRQYSVSIWWLGKRNILVWNLTHENTKKKSIQNKMYCLGKRSGQMKSALPLHTFRREAPLCRLRCHFWLWKGNKSCHCQSCYWEHHALSPTGLAIVKRIRQSYWPWISLLWLAQLGSPSPPLPSLTPIPLPTQMPRICSRNKLKFLLLSDPQTMQIFFFLFFFLRKEIEIAGRF